MKLEVIWRQLVATGSEHLILNIDNGIHADSLSVGEIDDTAYRIQYEIDCDAQWNVQRVKLIDILGGRTVSLAKSGNDWWSDGQGHALQALDGCTDVDIMITPFTNTLPIRALNLKPQETREIAVTYLGLPNFEPVRFEQRYTCLELHENGGVYRYENVRSSFRADLKVDADGLVIDYPNIFVMDAKRRLSSD